MSGTCLGHVFVWDLSATCLRFVRDNVPGTCLGHLWDMSGGWNFMGDSLPYFHHSVTLRVVDQGLCILSKKSAGSETGYILPKASIIMMLAKYDLWPSWVQ